MKYYHLDQLSDVFQRMGVSAIKIQKGNLLLMAIMFKYVLFFFSHFKYIKIFAV